MKKVLYIIGAISLIWACNKIEEIDQPFKDESMAEVEVPVNLPEVIYASMAENDTQEDVKTRTYVDDDRKSVLWHNGDAVSYFAGENHNAKYVFNGENGAKPAVFDFVNAGTAGEELSISYGVYPYDESISFADDKLSVVYASEQTYAHNSFGRGANLMVAAGMSSNDDNLYFRNACGYLVIKLYGAGTTVKSISLSSLSGKEKIAGPAFIYAENGKTPEITMADDAVSVVTMNCGDEGVQLGADKATATEFWFALPPVEFKEGIKITVTDFNDRSYTKETSKSVNIRRNEVQPMAALHFTHNLPASTQIWYTKAEEGDTPTKFYDNKTNPFDATISKHYFDATLNKFVIEFNGPVTTISKEAFRNTKIQTITLPESLVEIEKGAFRNTPLSEITIPGSINTIGVDAFYDCSSLASVTFLASETRTPLSIGYTTYGTADHSPFYYTRLNSINLNRELVLKDDDGDTYIADDWDEGMFAHKNFETTGPVSVTLGQQVETISPFMFSKLAVQTLTIPGSVNTIANDVFYCCTGLESITFEPSPTGTPLTIGFDTDGENENLFQDNNKLATLNLDREIVYTLTGVDTASEGAFGGMQTLTNVTLGNQVKTLTPFMFAGSRITSLTIPASVTTIGENAFDGCSALSTLIFEESSEPINIKGQGNSDGPFYDSPLTHIDYTRNFNYKKLDNSEFKPSDDTDGIFAIHEDLKSFDDNVDEDITATYTVTIGKNIETIPERMFCNLMVRVLTIPGTVNTIGNNVFNGCSELEKITFEPSPTETPLTMGYNTDGEEDGPFLDSPLMTVDLGRQIDYTLSYGDLDATDEGVFSNREDLTTVILGDQVRTLSDYMFANTALDLIDLNKVETIGNGVFWGSKLISLSIPANLHTIGINAFTNCDDLKRVYFNDSTNYLTIGYQYVNSAQWGPFYDSPLNRIYVGREIKYVNSNGNNFKADESNDGLFASEESVNDITITLSENVKTISQYMFSGLRIQSLEIPASVEIINENAFVDCDYLTSIKFKDSSKPLRIYSQCIGTFVYGYGPFYDSPLSSIYIGRDLDYRMYGASYDDTDWYFLSGEDTVESATVTIANGVTSIPHYAFADLPITEITIPGTVTSIGDYAFEHCDKLSKVIFQSGTETLTVGYSPGAVDDVGIFYYCPLSEIYLDREIVPSESYKENLDYWDMGVFSNKYYDKGNLSTTVTLGSNVKTIMDYMFSGVRMQNVTIPASVTSIGTQAFYDCRVLNHVKCLNEVPPTMGTDVFTECSSLGSTNSIAVPSASLSAYQEATNWSVYSSRMYGFGITDEN